MKSSRSRGRFSKVRFLSLTLLVLIVVLNVFLTGTETILPVSAQNGVTLRFEAVADAYVEETQPNANYGDLPYLQVQGADERSSEGYIRFVVSGISGKVQSARLRVYTTNTSITAPAVYATNQLWTETNITWENRPEPITALDNQGEVNKDAWVEYIVTPRVIGDGNYNFVLVGNGNTEIRLASREADHPPQLEITFIPSKNSITSVPPTPFMTQTAKPLFTDILAPGDVVFVGAGDISTCSNDDDENTAQLLDGIPGTVFTTGDNAYPDGTYTQYINCYDLTWGRHKERTKPIPGNHEYNMSEAAGYFQYFDNPPLFYAYDLGSWRIYALNSEINSSVDSPQVDWLKNDLAANPKQCVLAYWHTPRWSSGGEHGSAVTMQTLWEIFADAGAELVLNGHDHNYERFTPMDRNGQPAEEGLREIVVGTGGAGLYSLGTILDTSEASNDTSHGVLKLILHSDGYSWEFVPIAGDTFTDSGSDTCH